MKMKRMILAALVSFASVYACGQAQQNSTKEVEVRNTLATFIQAFDSLDWERFRNSFTDDATVFYPRAFPQRADGRAEFESAFRKVFEQIRGAKTKAPYMDIQPRELEIRFAGDAAIVTFHLDDRPGLLNRRTVILEKLGSEWKIIHLHASEVAIQSMPAN